MKGSIEKRGEKSWRLTVDVGTLTDGTRDRRRKTVTIEDPALLKTKKKLKDYLEEQLMMFKKEIEAGEYIKPGQFTFKEFVEQKYTPLYLNKLSPNTITAYTGVLKKHIIPFFGSVQMDSIKTLHCVDYMSKLEGFAVCTRLNHYTLLKSVFNAAKKWCIINFNPMDGVDRPKGNTKSTKYYDSSQVKIVLAALNAEPMHWRIFFTACMFGGFRRGELLALCWEDVDFVANTISINKALADGGVIKGPKSTSSIRTVAMPEWFMEDLTAYKKYRDDQKACKANANNNVPNLVFHKKDGGAYYPTDPSMRWCKFTKRHGLPHIRLHDLRHTAATILLESNVSLKVIQERLGHSNFQMTANIYSHVTKKLDAEAVGALDKFRPQSVPNTQNQSPKKQ